MEWLTIVGTAWGADTLGIKANVDAFVLGFQILIFALAALIISWRGLGVLAGHSREIAEVSATVIVGLILIIVAPALVSARIAAGATGGLLIGGSQLAEDVISFGLIAVPQWGLATWAWLGLRRRVHG